MMERVALRQKFSSCLLKSARLSARSVRLETCLKGKGAPTASFESPDRRIWESRLCCLLIDEILVDHGFDQSLDMYSPSVPGFTITGCEASLAILV